MSDTITKMPILSVADLAAGYSGMPVLQGFSLEISPGMILLIKGMNGSGKTTLLRCCAGLLPPLAGRIMITGTPLAADRLHAARRTIYIGHRDGLAAELTSEETLNLWAASRGLCPGPDDLKESFAALGMGEVMDQPLRTLSQGQQRRVSMTRLALITRLGLTRETPLWLLDEPTTAMDSTATKAFAALMHAHAEAGGAAVLTTHHDPGIIGAETLTLLGRRNT
ncbi:heme ABC exporter ATP-binding protein CcmA [Alphaproteobacteria bacterium LSUCC0684]